MKKSVHFLTFFCLTLSLYAEKPIVKDIYSQAGKGTRINISWTLPASPDSEITGLLVYKNTKPINTSEDLLKLQPVATLRASEVGYTDSVTDFNDYYYAVIAITDKPYNFIMPTVNATITGVHLIQQKEEKEAEKPKTEKLYKDGTMRETPLPFIDYVEGMEKESLISESTIKSTKKLSKKSQKDKKLTPYYFEEDLISPDGGDDFLLFNILKNYFVIKDYKTSILYLEKLVGTNISDTTRNRAYFYLGEANYFMGNYDTAIRTFVKVESQYPTLSKKWITSSLDLL